MASPSTSVLVEESDPKCLVSPNSTAKKKRFAHPSLSEFHCTHCTFISLNLSGLKNHARIKHPADQPVKSSARKSLFSIKNKASELANNGSTPNPQESDSKVDESRKCPITEKCTSSSNLLPVSGDIPVVVPKKRKLMAKPSTSISKFRIDSQSELEGTSDLLANKSVVSESTGIVDKNLEVSQKTTEVAGMATESRPVICNSQEEKLAVKSAISAIDDNKLEEKQTELKTIESHPESTCATDELARNSTALESSNNELEQLEVKKAECETKIVQLNTQIADGMSKIASLRFQHKQLKKSLAEKQQRVETVKTEQENLTAKEQDENKMLDELEGVKEKLRQKRQGLVKQKLKSEMEIRLFQCGLLNKQLAALQSDVEHNPEEDETIGDSEIELVRMQFEINMLVEEEEELKRRIDVLQSSRKATRQLLDSTSIELNEMEKQLDDLKASISSNIAILHLAIDNETDLVLTCSTLAETNALLVCHIYQATNEKSKLECLNLLKSWLENL